MVEFRLADVGEGIDAGEIVQWHVSPGDSVREDQDLVDIQSDKAIVTIPCPTDGTVLRLGGKEGDTVKVGEILAVFSEPSDRPVAVAATDEVVKQMPLAAPAVRRLARQRGIDLRTLSGSGPDGRIRREDLDTGPASASMTRPSPATTDRAPSVSPLRGIRRLIARNMTEAWQSIPHIIDLREVDATALLRARGILRDEARARGETELESALTLLPLLAKIAVSTLTSHPALNSSVDMEREEITVHRAIHMSFAVATTDGLFTPVIRDADQKSLHELAYEIAQLVRGARDRRLTPDQLAGGTFTVNNYGALGSSLATPIIPLGQAANLGFGRVEDRPWVIGETVQARPVLALSCSGDHRLMDGSELASYVNDVAAAIAEPIRLLGMLR